MLNLDDYIYKLFLDIRNTVLRDINADIKYLAPNSNRHPSTNSHMLSIFLDRSSAYLYFNPANATFTYYGQAPHGITRMVVCDFKLSDPDLRIKISERIINDLRSR